MSTKEAYWDMKAARLEAEAERRAERAKHDVKRGEQIGESRRAMRERLDKLPWRVQP